MVSQHGEDAPRRPQAAKCFCDRLDKRARIAYEIAGDGHQVRAQTVGQTDGLFHPLERSKEAVVDVGELNNAEAMERFRQALKPDRLLRHLDAIPAIATRPVDILSEPTHGDSPSSRLAPVESRRSTAKDDA